MPRMDGRKTLLIDADDTLWENHAYFLRVFDDFLAAMAARGHAKDEASRVLREIEAHRTRTFGYGSINYARSLVLALQRLEGRVDPLLEARFRDAGVWIHDHPIELFPRVRETLLELRERHRLLLVTKGNPDEQARKVERSALAPLFESVEILLEKDVERYRDLVRRHSLDVRTTWMIGNSPRSDINPALKAGLRTVFIPHRTLWELEAETLADGVDLHLTRFRELTEHF